MPDLWTPQGTHHVATSGITATAGLTSKERLEALSYGALAAGRAGPVDDPTVAEMRKNRRINGRRTAMGNGGGTAPISFATGRPRDPMFYWQQNNMPYDASKREELIKIRAYMRLLYMTHPTVASAVDIFSKYPLTGMELQCKDSALTDFYSTLFFDQLGYEDFLIDVGREYWTVGEAWPLGSFNETLGVWEDDELINPDDVEVIRSPFLKEPRFEMRLPEVLRTIIEKRQPEWEYNALIRSYPELARFATATDARMTVSNVLLKQLRFKGNTFNPRGIPILMRGMRSIMQEEMLNAAQDAIADRLYTPLILAKLGASATDLGTQTPWIPTEDDLANFEESLDAALSGDFRVLTHHFALTMDSVFGRETIPNMDADFERLEGRILQVFGLSKTMLNGADRGETYAADALNRDLVSQLLTNYQRMLKKLYRDRALVVAEAQEHYDYEERGGKRYPIMEEVLEVDPETGEERIVEQPKLLVPDLRIKAMSFQDEQAERQFLEALSTAGVPISKKRRLINVPGLKLEEEWEAVKEEQVAEAVAAQETRKETFVALRAKGLPIADDLKADFEPRALGAPRPDEQAAEPVPQVLETLGFEQAADTSALAPTPEDIASALEGQGKDGAQEPGAAVNDAMVLRLPTNEIMRSRPPESDEMRAAMPKAGSREEIEKGEVPGVLERGPRHIGLRRHAGIDPNVPLDEQVRRRQADLADPEDLSA